MFEGSKAQISLQGNLNGGVLKWTDFAMQTKAKRQAGS